jgi:dsDNA-binding SOS-regulon protein
MAVETRYVVIRNAVEVQTFVNKKDADDYDRMLDIADLISTMLEQAPVTLTEQQREELSIYLSKNRDKLLLTLQLKKTKTVTSPEEDVPNRNI